LYNRNVRERKNPILKEQRLEAEKIAKEEAEKKRLEEEIANGGPPS